jgi:hypothetical protein
MGQGMLQQGRAPTTGFLGRSLRSQLSRWGFMEREGGSGATSRRGSRSLSAPTARPKAWPRRGLRVPEPPPVAARHPPSCCQCRATLNSPSRMPVVTLCGGSAMGLQSQKTLRISGRSMISSCARASGLGLTLRPLPSLPTPPAPRPGSDQRPRSRSGLTLPNLRGIAELSAHNPNRTAFSRAQLHSTQQTRQLASGSWNGRPPPSHAEGSETRALFAQGSAASAQSPAPHVCAVGPAAPFVHPRLRVASRAQA